MPRAERAKQFAPFSALNGLEAALRKKADEPVRIRRSTLSDEPSERLDRARKMLTPDQTARVTYYDPAERRYRAVTVRCLRRDDTFRFLETDRGCIPFDDIRAVSPAEPSPSDA